MASSEPHERPHNGARSDTPAVGAPAPRTFPRWAAVTVLVALMLVSGAAGYALHGVIRRPPAEQISELDAIEAWRQRLAENPRDTASRVALAQSYQQSGRLRSALNEYDAVLRDNPRDTAALYQRGVILRELGQPGDAETAFWDVLEIEGTHVAAAEALGEYYLGKQQYKSLVQAVRPAAQAHPTEARLQYLIGFAYENLGRPDWAEARYRLALDAVPDMRDALEGIDRLKRAAQ